MRACLVRTPSFRGPLARGPWGRGPWGWGPWGWGPWARSLVALSSLLVLPLGFSACITSPPAEYGATPAARRTELPLCKNGLLDDGEDGNGQIIKVGGRDGYWFTFVDTEGSDIAPRGPFQMAEGGRTAGGSLDASRHYAHLTGKLAPAGKSLYAGVGFALSNPKSGFDLSKAQGIQFWAKGPGMVRFKTPDVNTDPVGDRCDDCYNDFGVDIYLSDRWERYTVLFDQMEQQPGWGDRAPYVASGGILAVQWQFTTPGASFDLSFDDVALVGCADSEPPPAAPVPSTGSERK